MSSYENKNNTLTKFASNVRMLNTPMEQYVTEGEFLQTKEEINTQFDKVAEDISNVTNPSIALKPTVIFSFDQISDDSRFTILEDNGFRGCFAMRPSSQTTEDTWVLYKELIERGHDYSIYNGNVDGQTAPKRTASVSEWVNYIKPAIDYINAHGIYNPTFYSCSGHFCTGNQTIAAKQLGFKYIRAATVDTTNTQHADHSWFYPSLSSFNPFEDYIKPNSIGSSGVSTIKGFIDDAITNNYSICLFSHTYNTDGYTEADYREVVEYIKEKVDEGVLQVLTPRQYYDMYRHENDFRQNLIKEDALVDLSDTSISTPQNGDVLVFDGEKWENAVFDAFEREKVYTPIELTYDEGKYIKINTGEISSHASYHMAEVTVTSGDKYRVVGTYNLLSALYAFYDSNGNVISTYPTTTTADEITEAIDILIPNNVVTLKISGKLTGCSLLLYKVTNGNSYKLLPTNDILYGKKWFACGDSFTKGDFSGYVDSNGKTMYESDAFDRIDAKWKTYSYWINKRTHINSDCDTCARGGMRFTNVTGASNPFSSDSSSINYTMIPSDCDYITLQFGLNELNLTTEQIGTSADTTNETLWGAYYVVLNSILTNNPSVKIGIIISDGHMNQTYHDALINIAKYWGIPYLDLKNGELVPMMNLGRLDACSEAAKNLRDSVFAISASNQHPTPVGHKYRSTVIENFLRTL